VTPRRAEPPPALDDRHRPLTVVVLPPQHCGVVTTVRIDYMNGQVLTVVEVPQLILPQAMERREVLSFE
jgi:hypothetical protein